MKLTVRGSRVVVGLLILGIALLSSTTPVSAQCEPGWLPGDGLPGTDGAVYATTVWDPDGLGPQLPGLVAGGEFSVAGGVLANNIAYWDGVSWHPLGNGVSGPVRALAALPTGDLVAGGEFTTAGDVDANYIARWDGSSWHALGSGVDDWVQALTVFPNGDLIAGGNFWQAGDADANYIARWDGLSWYPLGTGMDNRVQALTVLPTGDLVAGGGFWSAGDVEANYIARWDGSAWYALGSGVDYLVWALTVLPDGSLIAGGDFTTAGGASANYIARWNGSAWYPLGNGMDGWLRTLAVLPNGDLVAGGRFMTAGDVMCQNIARWDGASWQPLGGGMSSTVQASTVLPGGDLVAAGDPVGDDDYRLARDTTGRNIARWDGSSWHPFGTGMNDAAWALTVLPNGDLVAGGDFTVAGGVSANYIARRSGSSWHALGSGLDAAVQALTVLPSGDVVAGGDFTTAGDVSVGYVARWDGSSWHALGIGMDWSVSALTVLPDGDIVAGGSFWGADDVIVNRIARWDGASWHGLGSGMNGTVYALAVLPNGDLIAAGDFTTAGDVEADHIARWDGASWHPLGSGTNAGIRALAVLPNGDLVTGGGFTMAGDGSAYFVARWDGSSWHPLGSGMEYVVWALTVLPNGDLIAGGSFWQAGDVDAHYIARWDGTSWHPLSSGMNGQVGALTGLPNGDLVAGGDFSIAGGQVSAYWAHWGSTGGRGDLVVSSITVDPTAIAGRPLHVAWDIFNNDPNETACRGFVDALYVSADTQWDIDDLKLGSMVHGTDLGPQSGDTAEMDIIAAGVLPGQYYILLRTDEYNAVEEGETGEQNNFSASDPVSITIDELILSTPWPDEFTEIEPARYYQVTVTDGEDLQVTLDDFDGAGVNELYASYEAIPTRSRFDFRDTSNFAADQVLRVPGTLEGTYYILAYALPTDLSDAFAISAEYLPFQLLSATPNAGGNVGSVTIRLAGARFSGDMSVSLLPNGGEAHAATTVNVLDSARLDATFDLTSLPPGPCDVQVIRGSEVATLAQSFEVVAGGGAILIPTLSLPSATRIGRRSVMYATVANTGTIDGFVPVTWLVVPSGMQVTLDPETEPTEGSILLDFTRPEDPQHILPPGASVTIPVYYRVFGFDYYPVSLQVYDVPAHVEDVIAPKLPPPPPLPAQVAVDAPAARSPLQWHSDVYNCTFTLTEITPALVPSPDLFYFNSVLHSEFAYGFIFLSGAVYTPQSYYYQLYQSDIDEEGREYAGCRFQLAHPASWIQVFWDNRPAQHVDPYGRPNEDTLPFYWNAVDSGNPECSAAFGDLPGVWLKWASQQAASSSTGEFTRVAHFETHAAAWEPPYNLDEEVMVDDNGFVWGYTLNAQADESNNGNGGGTNGTGSQDPNLKVGPSGFGTAGFVGEGTSLPYTALFENVDSATAAALEVRVTDGLAPEFDWTTLALDTIAFGDVEIKVPEGLSHYAGRVEMDGWTWNQVDGWHRYVNGVPVVPLAVDVDAGIDIETGLVHWTIAAVDRNTGNPPEDPYAGFLPPNEQGIAYPDPNHPGMLIYPGEGRVTYRVRPQAGLPSGTQLVNKATIRFDTNAPLDTPETLNTIDNVAPSSCVSPLPAETNSGSFSVEWSGQDDESGCGIGCYWIYVSIDGGPFTSWKTSVDTSATFAGQFGCQLSLKSRHGLSLQSRPF